MVTETIIHLCRRCGSSNIVKNGHNASGSQQFWCKDCGKRGVLQPRRGYTEEQKEQILDVAIRMLPNVQQATIQPVITSTVKPGSLLYTDEDDIYSRLTDWGYEHKTVNHSQGEYARDEDGDGFHEVHINTLEGFWSLLRSWLRPHRGISQEKLPLDLGFFEFVHNVRRRGKALLSSLLTLLLAP